MFSNCLLNNFQVFMGHVNLGRFNSTFYQVRTDFWVHFCCIKIYSIFHSLHVTIAFNALIAFVLNNQSNNLAHSKKESDCS